MLSRRRKRRSEVKAGKHTFMADRIPRTYRQDTRHSDWMNRWINLRHWPTDKLCSTHIVKQEDVGDAMEDKNQKITKEWYINAFSAGPMQCRRWMNDILLPSLLFIVHLTCLWNHYGHAEYSGRHPDLEHQFRPLIDPSFHARQHVHGNLSGRLSPSPSSSAWSSSASPPTSHIVNLFIL